jgi:hypothetical protein
VTFALIANTSEASSDGSAVTTPGIDTSGADLLVLWVSGQYQLSATPTDSKGNTWTALTEEVVVGGERGIFYYAKNATVGSGHTFSVSQTSKLPSLCVAAFSGGHLTTPADQESGADTFGSTLAPGSITPTENDELVVTGISFNVAGTFTIGSSFTITNQEDKTAANLGGAMAYIIQTSAAAVNPTWTHNPGGSSMAARIASFKIAGGGGRTTKNTRSNPLGVEVGMNWRGGM